MLCMLYSITASMSKTFICFARRTLVKVLSRDTLACVNIPTTEEIRTFQATIREKYSMLHDVYSFADGLKRQLEQSGDAFVQEILYKEWTHDHYAGNVFVLAPKGAFVACAVNARFVHSRVEHCL